jgi:hypothetical protein
LFLEPHVLVKRPDLGEPEHDHQASKANASRLCVHHAPRYYGRSFEAGQLNAVPLALTAMAVTSSRRSSRL